MDKLRDRVFGRGGSARRLRALLLAAITLPMLATACDPPAQTVQHLALGGATNYLGTGQIFTGVDRENRWLAISGACASREQGERFTTVSDANYSSSSNPPSIQGNAWVGCAPGTSGHVEANPEHRAFGYVYAFEVPEAHSGPLSFEVFDAPYCAFDSGAGDAAGPFSTRYTVIGSADGGAVGPLASVTVASSNRTADGCRMWRSVHTVDTAAPGTYLLQVEAIAPTDLAAARQEGSNNFALRAVSGGVVARCTSDPQRATETTPLAPSCVTVSAVGGMGILQSFPGSMPTIPVRVGPEHAGGTLVLELWDVGEGTERIRLLAPDGTPVTVRWTVLCGDGSDPVEGACAGEVNPTGGRHGVSTQLDTSGSNHPQPTAHRLSSSRYNDRLLRIEADIAEDSEGAYGGGSWWQVQYQACANSGCAQTDRLTMSAFVHSGGEASPD